MFCRDRDLLALEPGLFRDCLWAAHVRVRSTGSLAGGIISLDDPALAGAAVAPGMVALFAGVPLEITSTTGDTKINISLLRPDPADAPILPRDADAAEVVVHTFAAQIALAHARMLHMLGLRPAGSPPFPAGSLDETAVTNPRDLAHAEALCTLHLIYSAAAAGLRDDSPAAQRAAMYRARFTLARAQARALIDTTGDGIPDAARTLNTLLLQRA